VWHRFASAPTILSCVLFEVHYLCKVISLLFETCAHVMSGLAATMRVVHVSAGHRMQEWSVTCQFAAGWDRTPAGSRSQQ
jgi:hypothetical protein